MPTLFLHRSAALLLALAAISASPRGAAASGGVVPEMGARKLGMGAIIGRPDDLSAIYHNPAGLVLSPGVNVYLNVGVALLDTEMQLRPWEDSDRYISDPVDAEGYYPPFSPSRAFGVIPMLVASTNLLSDKLVLALGFFVPNAVGAAFERDSVVRYHLVDSYYVTVSASLALAWRPLPWLAVGAAANLLYMRAHVERFFFPKFGATDLDIMFKGDSVLELGGEDISFSGTFGILLWPLPNVSFGAVLITRSNFELAGDATISFGPSTNREGGLSGTGRTFMFLPWTVQFGINWDVTPWLELAGELRYYVYSQQKELRIEVEGIPLLTELVTPKDYHNSYHLGGGFMISPPPLPGLELMVGYHYDYSPAPDSKVSVEQPTFSHHGLRLGARYQAHDLLRFSLTYVHYWYVPRSTDRSSSTPPSNYRGSGENHIMSLNLELTFKQLVPRHTNSDRSSSALTPAGGVARPLRATSMRSPRSYPANPSPRRSTDRNLCVEVPGVH